MGPDIAGSCHLRPIRSEPFRVQRDVVALSLECCYRINMVTGTMQEIHLPVWEFPSNLESAILETEGKFQADGYTIQDRYYEFGWNQPSASVYVARFKKLLSTPDGTPTLTCLFKRDGEQVTYGFLILIFGSHQDIIRDGLSNLAVGETIAFRFDLGA